MSNQVQAVKFYDDTLITLEKDGEHYVAVRPIVENMGLDWKVQHRKLVDNPKFSCGHMTTTGKDGKNPLDKVGFLFYSIYQGVRTLINSGHPHPKDLRYFYASNICDYKFSIMLGGRRNKATCRTNNPNRLLTVSEPPSTLSLSRYRHMSTPLMIG